MNLSEQLKRDGHLLFRPTKEAKKRKGIPKFGAKKKADMAIYRKMLPGWIKAHPYCEIGPIFHKAGIMVKCNGRTDHPHHIAGRRGKLLYTESNLLASCSGECHPQAVHYTRKKDAIRLNILK